jgi:ATP-dependent Lon protease
VRLYDPQELEAFRAKLLRHHSSSDDRNRAKAIIKELYDLGPWRRPLRATPAILRKLEALRCEFPNFAEVIDHYRGIMVLYCGAVMAAPVLLNGPAGCGKSYFTIRLAEALGTPFRLLDAAATSASFALVGSDKAYENSQTGLLHEVLSGNESAAPTIAVDEIDKACARASDARYPLTSALYGLWEPRTARTFRDASVPQIALDTRYCVWICTSNDSNQIPEPILNRMRVFNVQPPREEAMKGVIQRLAVDVWRDVRRRGPPPQLGTEVLQRLSRMPVRSAKLAIAEAFAKAVLAKRRELVIEDLPTDAATVSRPMGFV